MIEVTVTLTVAEAEALLPWKGADKDARAWNCRADAAEDAQAKIRAELRQARREQPDEQEQLI